MDAVILFLILFLPVLFVLIVMFLSTTKNIRLFKNCLKSVALKRGWNFEDESEFFKVFFSLFKWGLSFKDRIKIIVKLSSFPKSNSAKLFTEFQYYNNKISLVVSSKIIKIKELNTVVSFVDVKPLPFDLFFQVTNRDVFHATEKLIIRDIQFNDPPFDKKFLILSNEPELLLRILDQDLRNKLMKLHSNAVIRYIDHTLHYEEEGYFKDEEYVENVIDIVTSILQRLVLYYSQQQ